MPVQGRRSILGGKRGRRQGGTNPNAGRPPVNKGLTSCQTKQVYCPISVSALVAHQAVQMLIMPLLPVLMMSLPVTLILLLI